MSYVITVIIEIENFASSHFIDTRLFTILVCDGWDIILYVCHLRSFFFFVVVVFGALGFCDLMTLSFSLQLRVSLPYATYNHTHTHSLFSRALS